MISPIYHWIVKHPTHGTAAVLGENKLAAVIAAARGWRVPWSSIARASLALSCVPEEYQVLYYNVFAPEPCRDFRARDHSKKPGTAVNELPGPFADLSRVSLEAGVNAGSVEEVFHRVRETTRGALSPEMEIVLMRLNPSLSRFQKWRLGRKIKKEKAHEYTL